MTVGGPKLPGKQDWAPPRRSRTRSAGFKAQAPVRVEDEELDGFSMQAGDSWGLRFELPGVRAGEWLGFGGWFMCSDSVQPTLVFDDARVVLTDHADGNWNKVGSLWRSRASGPTEAVLRFTATGLGFIAVHSMLCGRVTHKHLDAAPEALLRNMWTGAPEANFYDPKVPGRVIEIGAHRGRLPAAATLHLKSCNRCGRLLPINRVNEQAHLSYTNHCTAANRRPCRHAGFGRVVNDITGEPVELDYGFQLECRFCKKFEVNGAHNKQRTPGQMKEDGTRRRMLELLLEHLYEGTPQLLFKRDTGRDLADYVFERFDGSCFKCGTALASPRAMHLDHTRPLALMWPLGAEATSLCGTHNGEKRARPPVKYYTEDELVRLSKITKISLIELRDPTPNLKAVKKLLENESWFRNEFLQLPALARVHDGKLAADLLVKAINKVLAACPPPYNRVL